MIIFGTRLYGKVDEVPGLFHVSTQFFHIDFLPLIPTGSYAVFSEEGSGWRGANIGLSGKSVLVAWVRAACVIAVIAGVVFGIMAMGDRGGPAAGIMIALVLGGGGIAGFVATKKIPQLTHASYERALEIAAKAGINEEGMLLIDIAYEKISPAELEQEIAKIKKRNEKPAKTDTKKRLKKEPEPSDLDEVEPIEE